MVGDVCTESKWAWVNHSLSCVGPVNGFLCVSHCVQWVLLSPGSRLGSSGGWLRVGAGNWLQTCRQTAALTCRSHQEEFYKSSVRWSDWGPLSPLKGLSFNFLSGCSENKLYSCGAISVQPFHWTAPCQEQQSDRLFLILLFSCSASQGQWVIGKYILKEGVITC